jgi:hypothetical protein
LNGGCPPPFSQRPFSSPVRVADREPAAAAAGAGAEHAHDDVVARHAMNRVRPRVAGLLDELLRLDHLLDPRSSRLARDIQDVDPGRAEARHDQV